MTLHKLQPQNIKYQKLKYISSTHFLYSCDLAVLFINYNKYCYNDIHLVNMSTKAQMQSHISSVSL